MIFIKHPIHGYLAVQQMDEVHKRNGWKQCDIDAEIRNKKKPAESPKPGRKPRNKA